MSFSVLCVVLRTVFWVVCAVYMLSCVLRMGKVLVGLGILGIVCDVNCVVCVMCLCAYCVCVVCIGLC